MTRQLKTACCAIVIGALPLTGLSQEQGSTDVMTTSYETVWHTINEIRQDSTFGELDWDEIYDRYYDLVIRADLRLPDDKSPVESAPHPARIGLKFGSIFEYIDGAADDIDITDTQTGHLSHLKRLQRRSNMPRSIYDLMFGEPDARLQIISWDGIHTQREINGKTLNPMVTKTTRN